MTIPTRRARIAVTGSTGKLGGGVARRLAEAGLAQRLLVRDLLRAPRLPGADPVCASFADASAVREALTGVAVVLMVSASETPERVDEHRAFVDAAASAGVEHIVYTSFFGAAPDSVFTLARDHWATEQAIRATGLRFTFLRDNLYADFLPAMVGTDGVIRGPAEQGRFAAVARDDIADAASAVLMHPHEHAGATYQLTGPDAVTFDEVARILSRVLGKTIAYRSETIDEAYASRASYGAPAWQVDAWVSTYTAIARGAFDGVTGDVERLTGHAARTVADVVGRATRA